MCESNLKKLTDKTVKPERKTKTINNIFDKQQVGIARYENANPLN